MTESVTRKLNARRYGELLAQVKPRPIQSEEENERLLTVVDGMMAKGDEGRTPEEEVLLELLCQLIERFEQEHYPIPDSPPHRVLQFLLEQNDLRQNSLFDSIPLHGERIGSTTSPIQGSKMRTKRMSYEAHQ